LGSILPAGVAGSTPLTGDEHSSPACARSGHDVLTLDGVDEIPVASRKIFAEWINQAIGAHPSLTGIRYATAGWSITQHNCFTLFARGKPVADQTRVMGIKNAVCQKYRKSPGNPVICKRNAISDRILIKTRR